MSGTTIINPPPGLWGAFRLGDTDTRTKVFSDDLKPVSDKITSVASVTITRQDGKTMGGSDLALVGQPILDNTALNVTLWLTGGMDSVTYLTEIVVKTAGGRTLGRDTLMTVMKAVG